MYKKTWISICVCLVLIFSSVSISFAKVDRSEMALLQGYDAFQNEDWISALFFFRKAVSVQDAPEETWYMLILSEMFAEEYASAINDCDLFISKFPSGKYYPFALYQKGRALHHLASYDEAVAQLTEFCHLYPDHKMYASALFWIAESFFNEYNYSAARVLYERIVTDFSRDAKSVEAQARLRTIGQAEREEKLLYLLKVTGEEYIASKEEYERQIRQYESEGSIGLYDQLQKRTEEVEQLQSEITDLDSRNIELEKRVQELEGQNRDLLLSAEEARRVATDVAVAAGKSVRDAQEAEAAAVEAAHQAQLQAEQAQQQMELAQLQAEQAQQQAEQAILQAELAQQQAEQIEQAEEPASQPEEQIEQAEEPASQPETPVEQPVEPASQPEIPVEPVQKEEEQIQQSEEPLLPAEETPVSDVKEVPVEVKPETDVKEDKKYPELDELKRKAAEIQLFLEQKAVGGR